MNKMTKTSGSLHLKTQGSEEEHVPIQRQILKEIFKFINKEEIDPTKDQESRGLRSKEMTENNSNKQ